MMAHQACDVGIVFHQEDGRLHPFIVAGHVLKEHYKKKAAPKGGFPEA
jgi:hypothetical protein